MEALERTHALTQDAPASRKPWTVLLSRESLRYHGSGWWLDAILPRSPGWFCVAAVALPLAWFALGLGLAEDTDAYVDTPDVKYQVPFLALHLVALRMMGSLLARGLGPSLDGLGIEAKEQRFVRGGLLGRWANLGALFAAAFFIARDSYMSFVPDDVSGLDAYYDPEMWDFGALGDGVRGALVGLWHFEWIVYGHLLWFQIWALVAMGRALRRTDFTRHLARLLIHDEYRDFFAILGKAATLSMVFALGNLLFIHLTGELFPREVVVIDGVGSFITEMSDLLSVILLFAVLVLGFVVLLRLLRSALTRAVNEMFAEAGDAGLEELARPLVLSGDAAADVERLRARLDAQAGLVRAIAFQREVDALGGRTLRAIALKSGPVAFAAAKRVARMSIGAP